MKELLGNLNLEIQRSLQMGLLTSCIASSVVRRIILFHPFILLIESNQIKVNCQDANIHTKLYCICYLS